MIIYLETMPLMGLSIEKIRMCHNRVVLLLQRLDFVIIKYFGIIAGDQTFGAKNQLSQPRNISHR